MTQGQNTELQLFNGGLHTRPKSHLIELNEARSIINVDLRSRTLSPYRTAELLTQAAQPYFYFFRNQFYFFALRRSNVLWNRVWYWSDGSDTGKMLEDGTELPLGISPPTTRLDISEEVPTSGDGLTGNINYVYTYYDPLTGAESPPSPPSITLDVDDKAIEVTGFESSTDYSIRLYRIGGIITAYTAVETVSGQITTYVDQKKFSEIEATILDTLRSFPPPSGLRNLTESQGRFFGSVDSKLYFSAVAKPDSWYALDFITLDTNIIMLAAVANGLLIGTKYRTWVLAGTGALNFHKYLLSESEGCESSASVATMDGSAIWLSGNGIVMSNGAMVQNISIDKIGAIRRLDPLGSMVYDRKYYLAIGGYADGGSLVPESDLIPGPDGGDDDDPDVGGLVPGATGGDTNFSAGALLIDFSTGTPIISVIEEFGLGDLGYYDNRPYQMTNPTNDDVNIVTEDGENNLVTENGVFNIVASTAGVQQLKEMFKGTELKRFRYISPLLTEGSIGTEKQYEKLRVTYLGIFKITMYDDGKRVMQEFEVSADRRSTEWLRIPIGENRAYGVQIRIIGVGVVDSLMYTWKPWETQ